MKIISTLAILSLLGIFTQPVFSTAFTKRDHIIKITNGDNKKKISIVSKRGSADMQLLFSSDKDGDAMITVSDESGKIILQQTNQLTNSINTISLKNAAGLAEGAYSVRLISNNEIYTTNFLIWK